MAEQLRRAHALASYWHDEEFRVENYVARRAVAIPPVLLQMLPSATDYVSRADLGAALTHVGLDAAEIIERLIDHGIVLEKDSELDLRDQEIHSSWRWGHEARWFHFASSDVQYVVDRPSQERLLAELVNHEAPPPPQRRAVGDVLSLPGTFRRPRGGLWSVLLERRTRRIFQDASIDLATLGQLMLWTWGATEERCHQLLGRYFLKTSPSGGARHPIDVYLLAHRVAGLAPRAYRYLPRDHALEDLGIPIDANLLQDVFAGHHWFRSSAASFLMTAVMERNAWKYRHSHAYRVLLLDAGHLGQTFHLVCTAMGLAPFTTAAIDDAIATSTLGLDPAHEIVVYAAATGLPGISADIDTAIGD
jgi:SagB-type dehydrogenase family enzyme